MTPLQIGAAIGCFVLLIMLWRAQRSRHPFDWKDALMDPATDKASLNALILVTFAALSVWVVVDRENDGQADVPTLLSTVLGIFVVSRVGSQAITAFKPSPDVGSTVKETVRETTVTAPAPPPVAAEPVEVAITSMPDENAPRSRKRPLPKK